MIDIKELKKNQKGFSLIELIVVVVILGILVAIAIPVYTNAQAKAGRSAMEASATNGASSVAVAIADSGPYAVDDVITKLDDSAGDGVAITPCRDAGGDYLTGINTTLDNVCIEAQNFYGTAWAGTYKGSGWTPANNG